MILQLKATDSHQVKAAYESGSSYETIQADGDAHLAAVNTDAALGILNMIKGLRHIPELTNCRNWNKAKQDLGIREIRKCKGSALVGYCVEECQLQPWGVVHKQECNTLRKITDVELAKAEVEERLKRPEG
jgi:hypothetical protein